jgi:hypothetical protein
VRPARIRRDAFIDDLHRIRKNIGKAHDFDVYRIATTIRRHERENPKGVVRESPKRAPHEKSFVVASGRRFANDPQSTHSNASPATP